MSPADLEPADTTPKLTWSQLSLGLLDWMLACALVASVYGVCYGGMRWAEARWTHGALINGVIWAFQGAIFGAVVGASWLLTRHRNLLLGISAGVAAGVTTEGVCRVAYQLFGMFINNSPDPYLPAAKRAFLEYLTEWQGPTRQALFIALFVACGARLFSIFARIIREEKLARKPPPAA